MSPLPRLRRARLGAKLSCQAAGDLIGKTRSHYAKIERGEVTLSAADALILCKRFKLTLEKLVSPVDTN